MNRLLIITACLVFGCAKTPYPVDTRVSPRGIVRPSLAKTTDIEHVAYDNPKNGKHSEYDLEVDRGAEGKVERLNFKNGGWREVDGNTTDNGDGTETYTAPNGYRYTITKPK